MDHMHLMTVFVAVGEQESFAGASRSLNMSPAAITRAVAALEKKLGAQLLLRTTRNVRLTEAGQRYLDDCRHILASIEEANDAASGVNAPPKGNVTVTASVLFGKTFVTPCIVQFLQQYPEVDVTAYFLDRVVNLVEEGMDVAVRLGPLPDSSMKALRVGQMRRVLCASPEYLAGHGVPQQPEDLQRHTIIAASNITPRVEWKFGHGTGAITVRMKPRFTVSSNDAAVRAAVEGLGICRLLSYQMADELAAGKLKIILAEFEEEPWPVHILHRESKYGSSRVRKFIDLLAQHLRTHPHLA
ncbi:LysR family transcriptional regulator [Pseudoduganella sp. HUAS MS19]